MFLVRNCNYNEICCDYAKKNMDDLIYVRGALSSTKTRKRRFSSIKVSCPYLVTHHSRSYESNSVFTYEMKIPHLQLIIKLK